MWEVGDPADGNIEPLRQRYRFGIGLTRPMAFAAERRRGWTEVGGSAPYDRERDLWDEHRGERLVMERGNPRSAEPIRLTVAGSFAAFREGPPAWARVSYTLVEADGTARSLASVQWADWADDGRLLVATTDGHLQIWGAPFDAGAVEWSVDVSNDVPDPEEPPSLARRWAR